MRKDNKERERPTDVLKDDDRTKWDSKQVDMEKINDTLRKYGVSSTMHVGEHSSFIDNPKPPDPANDVGLVDGGELNSDMEEESADEVDEDIMVEETPGVPKN